MNTYNMKFHAWFRGVLGGLLVAFIASCDDSDLIRRVEPTLEIQDELSMGPVASRQVIDLHSSYPWFAEASASWIKLKRYRGQALLPDSIVAEIEENPEMALREGWIEIRLMDQMSKRIVVKQNGRGSLITLSKEVLYFNINGGEAVLDVVTDLEWDVEEEHIFNIVFIQKLYIVSKEENSMVELIVGKKGKGKTKVLLDKVNGAIKEANGSIVYLDKSTKHMYELNNKVRLIDVSVYPIKNADEFVGFVCGIISQDHDLEQVYLDSFLTTAKLEGKDVTGTLEQLNAVGEKFNVKFVVSMSLDKEEIPESLQDKIVTAL